MSYSAVDTQGFEFKYNKAGFPANAVPYVLKPNTEFKKGQLVAMERRVKQDNIGEIFPVSNTTSLATATIVGVMAEAVAQADNPTLGITTGLVYDNPLNVYKVSFIPRVNGDNAVVDATHTTTTTMTVAGGVATDDRSKGALIYFYEGPGSPALRTISDIKATNDKITWISPLSAVPTADTKFYVTCGADYNVDGAVHNIGIVGGKTDSDGMKVDCAQVPALATGPLVIIGVDPVKMTFDVMLRGMLVNPEYSA